LHALLRCARIVAVGLTLALTASTASALVHTDGSPNIAPPLGLSVYDNVGRIGAGSGVYIGHGYVLTATHVAGSSFNLDGASLGIAKVKTFVRTSNNYASDVSLYRLTEPTALSHLSPIALAETTPARGSDVVLVGTGITNAGSRDKSWAMNQIASNNYDTLVAGNHLEGMKLIYNDLPNEGQAASGDSGGAVFRFVDGQYVLAGLMHAVGDGNFDGDYTDFGDTTVISDLSKYTGQLADFMVDGSHPAVPEPASFALLAFGAIACGRRRACFLTG